MSRLISNKHIHKDKQTKTNKHFNSTITQAAYLSFFFCFFLCLLLNYSTYLKQQQQQKIYDQPLSLLLFLKLKK